MELVAPQQVSRLLRGHGFGARLQQVELLVIAVLGPFDIHRAGRAALFAVVLLRFDGIARECQYLVIPEAVVTPACIGGVDIVHFLAIQVLIAYQRLLLRAELPAQHAAVPLLEGGLVYIELIRIHRALHDIFTETESGVDKHHIRKTAVGIQREHDTARGVV